MKNKLPITTSFEISLHNLEQFSRNVQEFYGLVIPEHLEIPNRFMVQQFLNI